MGWFPSGACGRERTIVAIMHGLAQMNFRKAIKERPDFDPLGRRDSGHIRGKILKMRVSRD